MKITNEEKMELFESDLSDFVSKFNAILEKKSFESMMGEILVPSKSDDGKLVKFKIRE
jgi:hypothetical protein